MRGLFSRPRDAPMVIRRIVGSVCALCLAAPAGAVASPGTDPPLPRGPYGVTAVTGPPSTARAKGPYGVTSVTGPVSTATVKGPYGVTPVTGPVLTAEVKGPYGVTPATATPVTASRTPHPAAAAHGSATSGWRIAAISEAALLAALPLGLTGLAGARRRAPRMVT